jgi:hypothetical protein
MGVRFHAFLAVIGAYLGSLCGPAVAGQPLGADTQYWLGTIDVPGGRAVQRVPIVVTLDRVSSPEGDRWSGTLDLSPGPNAPGIRGLNLQDVSVGAGRMAFGTMSGEEQVQYDLALSPDGARAEGRLATARGGMPVRLRRVGPDVARDAVIRRPQEPTAARGYIARDAFIVTADGATLYGTLTTPDGISSQRTAPGVVLVGDLGATDRDLSGAYHRPFLVLADALSRAGFAVLRLDDRGVGQSGGDERVATPEVSASDAALALASLAGVDGVDPARVGFIGLGEGAVTAALAALSPAAPEAGSGKSAARAAFVVMLSPRGVPMLDSQMAALEAQLASEGETGPYRDARLAARRKALLGAAESTSPYDAVSEPSGPAADGLRDELATLASFRRQDVAPAAQTTGLRVELADMTTPARVSRYRHDPAGAFERLEGKVLVLGAGLDMVNPAGVNVPAAVGALKRGKAEVTVREFPGLNQMLQPGVTGLAVERLQIETTIDAAALEAVVTWLRSAAGMEKP